MYWQDHYKTSAHAVRALQAVQRGQLRMTPNQLHIAHVAARAKLSGISEDPSNLGASYGLTELPHNLGGLKKDIKSALKSSNVAKIQKALDRESAKLAKAPDSKKAPKRLDYVTQLQAQLAVAKAGTVPSTPVLPGAPEQPIAQLPDLTGSSPMSFSQGGGGSGSTSMTTPEPTAAAAAADEGLSLPVMLGIGAAALLALYLLMKK
jgi:hypothetical protein